MHTCTINTTTPPLSAAQVTLTAGSKDGEAPTAPVTSGVMIVRLADELELEGKGRVVRISQVVRIKDPINKDKQASENPVISNAHTNEHTSSKLQ